MVECPNCHSQCEDGSDFCTVCGAKLNGVEQQNVNVQGMVIRNRSIVKVTDTAAGLCNVT